MAYNLGGFALALALTLVLAAFLTPRAWWRRPNLAALAILAAGTWGFGSLLLSFAPAPAMAATGKVGQPLPGVGLAAIGMPAAKPTAGRTYHVFEHLNLRAAGGTGTRRVAVVPPGTLVSATGAREGDWWEVSASIEGKRITGWVSSLWLRRADERSAPATPPQK
ncbi:MAG: hypothetical protein JWR40_2392 [Massilia sp.]|nr:hypothetical protein [Massilia sp.]